MNDGEPALRTETVKTKGWCVRGKHDVAVGVVMTELPAEGWLCPDHGPRAWRPILKHVHELCHGAKAETS